MGATKKIAVAVLALAAFSFLGAMDYSDALEQDAIEKEARPQRVIAADRLTFPLDFKAIVCQRTYYGERATCRYYAERTNER